MTKRLTIAEAQQQLLNLPSEVATGPVIITEDGQPVMAAISYEQLTSLLATIDIFSDSDFSEELQQSIAQVERGETIDWNDIKKELGL